MGAKLDISELVQVASRIESSAGRVGARTSAVVRRTALAIEADAKALAPVAEIDGGTLRNSISTTVTGDGRHGAMTAEIGPTAEYGIYQELGTSVMAAQPYLGPAFDRQIGGYTEAIAKLASDDLV